jgi:hypothetical protein
MSQLKIFKEIHSIELNEKLYFENLVRFRNNKNVYLYHGDSSAVIVEILKKINGRCIFWLDGHFDFTEITSKSDLVTPIRKELEEIAKSSFEHIILIDDARLFNGVNDYPTMEELKRLVNKFFPNHQMVINNDIIIIRNNVYFN